MPVTARLSRKLYDKLGDEAANEIVDWFNTVDLSYRAEFREMFATHFARIDSRLSEMRSELRSEFKAELARVEASLSEMRAELRSEFRSESANLEKSLIRWMFVFWAGSFAAIVTTMVALGRLGVLAGP
jgi:hypothetical protein